MKTVANDVVPAATLSILTGNISASIAARRSPSSGSEKCQPPATSAAPMMTAPPTITGYTATALPGGSVIARRTSVLASAATKATLAHSPIGSADSSQAQPRIIDWSQAQPATFELPP